MARPTLDELKELAKARAAPKEKEKGGPKKAVDGRRYHLDMLYRHGYLEPLSDARKCGECVHLKLKGGNTRAYHGCELSALGLSRSAASDWRMKWVACGKFEAKEGKSADEV